MRIFRSRPASVAVVAFVTAAIPAAPVVAHGGEGPSLEVVPNRVEPGETVTVLGEELEPLSSVQVDLLTAEGAQVVIRTQVDEKGHFFEPLVVPAELTPRVYELRGTDGSDLAVSTYLTVLPADQTRADTAPAPMETMSLAIAAALAAALILLIVRRVAASNGSSAGTRRE